jgi:hypothetical protein
MRYVFFDLSTGQIKWLSSYDPSTEPMPLPGMGAILTSLLGNLDITYRVENNEIVELPPKPFDYSQFNYQTKEWFDPRTTASELEVVKYKRNTLLSGSDWIVTKAMDRGTPVPEDWRVYRQALRDITLQPDIFNIIWPTAPQG